PNYGLGMAIERLVKGNKNIDNFLLSNREKKILNRFRDISGFSNGYTPNFNNPVSFDEPYIFPRNNIFAGKSLEDRAHSGQIKPLGSGAYGAFYDIRRKIGGVPVGLKSFGRINPTKEAQKEFIKTRALHYAIKAGQDVGVVSPSLVVPNVLGSMGKDRP